MTEMTEMTGIHGMTGINWVTNGREDLNDWDD